MNYNASTPADHALRHRPRNYRASAPPRRCMERVECSCARCIVSQITFHVHPYAKGQR